MGGNLSNHYETQTDATLSDAAHILAAVQRGGARDIWIRHSALAQDLGEQLIASGASIVESRGGHARVCPPTSLSAADFWSSLAHQDAALLRAATEGVQRGDARFAEMHGGSSPVIMGILNATPDSFSDGGMHASATAAIARGRTLLAEGATWIDVGGESTRPGAPEVPVDEEVARVLPVIEALAAEGARISIDTRKAQVAAAALAAGAELVNDVSGGLFDPAILEVTARADAAFCAMHMRGTPATMQSQASYSDAVLEVTQALRKRARAAIDAGISPAKLLLDPGVGFAKKLEHNLAVLRELDVLASLGFPLLVGLSRKKMLEELTGVVTPRERLAGSLGGLAALAAKGAHILRVHDVRESREALAVAAAILGRG